MNKTILLGVLAALLAFAVWYLRAGPEPLELLSPGARAASVIQPTALENGSAFQLERAAEPAVERAVLSAAAPRDPAPTLGPRLRVRTLFADGEVAPHVTFQYVSSKPGTAARTAQSDEEGLALLDGLDPGQYFLYGDRGGHGSATVPDARVSASGVERTAQELQELRDLLTFEAVLTLERGHDLSGRVVDAEGRPVAGAAIWISTGLTRSSGIEVARSAADGSFALRQLSPSCFVGARAEGFAPAHPLHVEHLLEQAGGAGQDGNEGLACELVLRGAGARVAGFVRDAAGHPLAGARVRLGAQDLFDSYGPSGVLGPPPPLEVRSDERGAFEGGGLAPGRVDVACQASGFAVGTAAVEVRAGELGRVEIVLEPAAWVRGEVLDAAESPVAGVQVLATERSLQGSGSRSSFGPPRATTDTRGSFVIGPLAAGEVHLYARSSSGQEQARTVLEVAAGRTYERTLELLAQPAIRGRALGVDGAPLASWTVSAQAMLPGGPPPRAVRTKADGSFELLFPSTGLVRLELRGPEPVGADGEQRSWSVPRALEAWADDVPVPSAGLELVPRADRAQNR